MKSPVNSVSWQHLKHRAVTMCQARRWPSRIAYFGPMFSECSITAEAIARRRDRQGVRLAAMAFLASVVLSRRNVQTGCCPVAGPQPARGAGERLVGRARVTDGDTLRVGGVAVRLKGLAAPEVAHVGDPGEPGGVEAKAFMVELVEGETVVCDLTQERTPAGGWAGAISTARTSPRRWSGLGWRGTARGSRAASTRPSRRQQHAGCRFRPIVG